MSQHQSMGAADSLEHQLKSEAQRLCQTRSSNLGSRIMAAIEVEAEGPGPVAVHSIRRWPLLASLAAAALALVFFSAGQEDDAHPAMRATGLKQAANRSAPNQIFTDQLRGLVNIGQALAASAEPNEQAGDLLQKEARLLIADVSSLASGVIAGLPLSALPNAWQERLETL